MTNCVDTHVVSCETCQRQNKMLEKPAALLHSISVDGSWHRVGIDLVGPFPRTGSGNQYIITCSDYFTKWPEAAAIPDKTVCGVANFLFTLITRHGSPAIIQSDQGREFVNQLNKHLFELTWVKHRISTAYHTQTNRLDERFNQTLVNSLTKMTGESQTSGTSTLIPSCSHTGIYVCLCNYHFRHIRIKFFVQLKSEVGRGMLLLNPLHLLQDLPTRIEKAQQKQDIEYDAKHHPPTFKVGGKVWVYNSRKETRQ